MSRTETSTATRTAYLPTPLSHQREVLRSPARFKIAACGRRWGKTGAALLAATMGHGPRPGAFRGCLHGGRIWWVAPTYKQIQSSGIWRDLKKALSQCWEDKSEVDRTIYLPGGGSICVMSAENESSLRGPGLDGLIVDEAAFIKHTAWTESLRPALTDKQGWALLISTPNGHNWFHDLHEIARGGRGYEAWQRPSSDNPLVTQDELDKIREEIGERAYAQEHLAQFMAIEGAEWPSEYFDGITADYWPAKFDLSVYAIDPSKGRDHGDFSAIVFAGLHHGRVWVDCSIARRPAPQIAADLLRMWNAQPADEVFVEANANQDLVMTPVINQLTTERGMYPLPLVCQENREKKEKRIFRLGPLLKNNRIKLRDGIRGCELLERQLRAFPVGEHDDGPDALAMALERLQRMARQRTQTPHPDSVGI